MMRGEDGPLQMRKLLNVLFKRKFQVLAFFLAVVATITAITFVMKPVYESTAQLLVTMGEGSVLLSGFNDNSPLVRLDYENVINSEIEILKSKAVAEKVINTMGGPKKVYPSMISNDRENNTDAGFSGALQQFSEDLRVEAIRKSSLISLSYRNSSPELSAQVLNNLAAIYIDHHSDLRRTKKPYEFFKNQVEILKGRLNTAEKTYETYKDRHNLTNFEEQKTIYLKQLSDLQTSQSDTHRGISEADSRLAELSKQLSATPAKIPREQQDMYNESLLSNLNTKLVELQLEEKNLAVKYTDDSRFLKNVRDEIAFVKRKIGEQSSTTLGRNTTGINAVYQLLQQDIMRQQSDRKALGAKLNGLTAQVAAAEQKLKELNAVEREYYRLRQDMEIAKRNYELYLTKLEETRISDAMNTERISSVSLVEPASVPMRPVSPKVLLNLLVAVFVGVLGGIALAFIAEILGDKITTPEDAERLMGVPVLTTTPYVLRAQIRGKVPTQIAQG